LNVVLYDRPKETNTIASSSCYYIVSNRSKPTAALKAAEQADCGFEMAVLRDAASSGPVSVRLHAGATSSVCSTQRRRLGFVVDSAASCVIWGMDKGSVPQRQTQSCLSPSQQPVCCPEPRARL